MNQLLKQVEKHRKLVSRESAVGAKEKAGRYCSLWAVRRNFVATTEQSRP